MFLWFLSQAIFAWVWAGWILTHFELILAKSQWFVSLSYTDSFSSLLIFSQVVLNDCQLEDGFRLVNMLLGEGWARNILVILLCFRVNFVLASLLCSSSWSSLKVQRTLEGRPLSLTEFVSFLQSHQKFVPKLLVYLFHSPGIQLRFTNIIHNIHEGCLQRLRRGKRRHFFSYGPASLIPVLPHLPLHSPFMMSCTRQESNKYAPTDYSLTWSPPTTIQSQSFPQGWEGSSSG